jgi:antitoxin (DNA-binding transcriptional repressor) of toxin-antitoxin stability system
MDIMDDQPRSAVRTINAGRARVNLGQMLDEVFYKGEQFIIERDGRPMAAVIPLSRLEALEQHHALAPKLNKKKSKRTG